MRAQREKLVILCLNILSFFVGMKRFDIIEDRATPAHGCLCKMRSPKGYEIQERKRNVELSYKVLLALFHDSRCERAMVNMKLAKDLEEQPMLLRFLRGRHP